MKNSPYFCIDKARHAWPAMAAHPVGFFGRKLFSLWLVRALHPCSAKARGFFTDFSFGFLGLYYEPSAAQVGGFLYYDKKY